MLVKNADSLFANLTSEKLLKLQLKKKFSKIFKKLAVRQNYSKDNQLFRKNLQTPEAFENIFFK